MVRNLVGALLMVGKGGKPAEWMAELLAARSRASAPPTFMPDGLYLTGVRYPEEFGLPSPPPRACADRQMFEQFSPCYFAEPIHHARSHQNLRHHPPEDSQAAARLGADAIGLVFYPKARAMSAWNKRAPLSPPCRRW